MEQLSVVSLIAGLLGVVVGLTAAFAFRLSERDHRRQTATPEPPALPEGAAAVLSVLPSAAVVVDDTGRVVKASAAAYAFGLVHDERLAHEETRVMAQLVRDTGDTLDEEFELSRDLAGPPVQAGPGIRYLQIRAAPLGSRHVLLLTEDRTESRRLEEIRRDFVANVSHELKTPVGAISLLAETVGNAADDPEAVRRFSGRMHAEATRLAALVQEIIELSRLQVADAFTGLTLVGLDEVVAEAVDRARLVAQGQNIEIETGAPSGVVVFGNHDLLVTAVRNLLDNAVHYSEPGTHVGIGAVGRGSAAEITVTDQGIGIAPAERDRIFERFYRVDPARSRLTGGTGLGLSIVKHVALNHGGEVTVWSQPDHGSTFTLRLPVAPGHVAGTEPGDTVLDLDDDAPARTARPVGED